jgi:outer membrane protein insertion porin family
VKVNFDLKLRPEEDLTSIYYSVDPGPVCLFGETTISGNKHIKEKYIRKEIKYKENKIYNKSLLDKTRRNLYLLQVFRVASVLPETDAETQRNPIPVKIFVQEAPRLTTNFGVGYGTEDKFRTYVDLTYKGIFGSPRRLNLHLKHSGLEPYTANLTWIQPQFFSARSSIAINPFITRLTQPAINIRSFGVNIPVTYQFTDWLHASLTYYLENVKQYVEAGDTTSKNYPYNKSGILISSAFNNSYPRFSPNNGESIMAGVKVNGYFFGGDFSYTKLWVDFRIYRQIWDWVVAYRFMIGGIQSADVSQFIPVEDRFYSGGSTSIRGWYLQELGPKRASGSPLGGKSIMENNFEFRIPLFWKLGFVSFLDAGNVWIPSYSYHLNDLAFAAGGGLRIDTPIGPVRFDIGFPLWNQKTSPQFFLSVGQAF